jgi:hypothetical protein
MLLQEWHTEYKVIVGSGKPLQIRKHTEVLAESAITNLERVILHQNNTVVATTATRFGKIQTRNLILRNTSEAKSPRPEETRSDEVGGGSAIYQSP